MMVILRACATCGKPSPEPYCSKHKPVNRRRQRMKMSGGAWEAVRRQIIARDLRCCYLCGQVVEDDESLEVDHLVPVAAGGSNSLTNAASAHRACHKRRHADPEWASERVEATIELLKDMTPTGVTDPERGAAP